MNDPLPPSVMLDRTVTYRLHALSKLSDRVTQMAYENEIGIPAHEGRCLAAVGAYSPLSVKNLARAANLDKAQASRAAQSLVEQNLIHKTASTTDGRGVVLTLTAQGQGKWQQVMQMVARRNREITSCLSPAEFQQFDRLLDTLVAHSRATEVQRAT